MFLNRSVAQAGFELAVLLERWFTDTRHHSWLMAWFRLADGQDLREMGTTRLLRGLGQQGCWETILPRAWNPMLESPPSPTRLPFFHFIQGSLDNMTCIVVCFPGAPRPCEEAIRRELALDAALGRRIAGPLSSLKLISGSTRPQKSVGRRCRVGPGSPQFLFELCFGLRSLTGDLDHLLNWGQQNKEENYLLPTSMDQRKEDKPVAEPQNASFPFSYFPLTEKT
ncbi:PREDICTED: probable protein phosphatase 1N isoform X3 [Chinchilla lanigera]|uniref:probable protein phosphatase 1N isoform X3 n=1 Tax=Chinchilla lanigera TaxID=34839 RepID=UPI0006984116|nr:PREDICTED: probable protein phosphatase 1N isoform X3 [Chinchilla lanigera]